MPLRLRQRTFPLLQQLGVHVTPNRYTHPIPDTRTLSESLWTTPSELVGIDLREPQQLDLLARFVDGYKAEFDRFPLEKTTTGPQYYLNNTAFESVDGEICYGMIRSLKPRKIVEIGSGFSSLLMAQAIARNTQDDGDYACEFTAIEPYPNPALQEALPGISRWIKDEVQNVPLPLFTGLGENDILFIDSSHVLKIGSDVQYEFLEILPRLASGVVVQIHDIFLPSEYPRDMILEHYQFPNEQYLVQAFLAFNRAFEILWAGSFMHQKHPEELRAAFASYTRDERWHGPGSLWLQRV